MKKLIIYISLLAIIGYIAVNFNTKDSIKGTITIQDKKDSIKIDTMSFSKESITITDTIISNTD